MRRIVSVILIIMILMFTVSCANLSQSKKEIEYEAANTAYQDLVKAHELCIDIMDSMYGAWYFSIYKYDDYSGSNGFKEFCYEANLYSQDALDAVGVIFEMDNVSAYAAYETLLDDFDWSIAIVEQVYKSNGTYNDIENCLSNAKLSLKSVTNEYSDYTGYSVLKSYYSEISAYYEFCKSPTGSFAQLKTTIDNYETNLRNYKNDLSFIFE